MKRFYVYHRLSNGHNGTIGYTASLDIAHKWAEMYNARIVDIKSNVVIK